MVSLLKSTNPQHRTAGEEIADLSNTKPAASMILKSDTTQSVPFGPVIPTVILGTNPPAASFLDASNKSKSSCEFALIMPSYNNENYYEENLDSTCFQNSSNPYHIYYINDCSTDATGKLVEEYVRKNGLEDRFTLINNTVNLGGGANIYNTIHKCVADHKIVVIIDGDDLFPHNNVLLTLEEYYKDPDLWMTYGKLQKFGTNNDLKGEEIPEAITKNNRIRQKAAVTALRTFRASLYKKIKKRRLLL